MNTDSYEEVRKYRDSKINQLTHDPFLLNKFHDELMLQVIKIAFIKLEKETGREPPPFSFFVMGSAGRFEQGIWSDQDHGIIYEEATPETKHYFLHLGAEISNGLYDAGYPYCHGEVMSRNPSWCKSLSEWQQQISTWVTDRNFDSIRSLLIFTDARTLYGKKNTLFELKHFAFELIHNEKLLPAVLSNTIYYKKGMGILGQLLTETHGSYSGQLNLKETALLPFVNAIRFLAICEKVAESSTLSRIDRLSEKFFSREEKEKYKLHFINLLKYRLQYGNRSDYEASHYVNIAELQQEQKKEIKEIIKSVKSLYHLLGRIIEKEGSYGNE